MRRALPAGLVFALLSLAAVNAAGVEELYSRNCAPCHGKDGKGNTPAGKKAGAKDLTISKTTPDEVERQIVEGKLDPKGTAKMPAFGGKISDEEIKSLAAYVLGLRKTR
jgi:cytochrome c6